MAGTTHPTDAGLDRRAELLAAATRVIARRGYAETRFQDVAEEAGVAVGTLQHHFGTRRRMLTEALEHWLDDDTEAAVESLRTGEGDAWARLEQHLRASCERLGRRAETWLMWLDFAGAAIKDRELRGSTSRSMVRWREAIASIIREGVAEGTFDPVLPPADVAEILTAVLDGTALQVYAMDSDVSGAEISGRTLLVARSLLRPSGV